MVNENDINELRRLATNTYENDKAAQIRRIILGINDLKGQLQLLHQENMELKKKLAAK